MIGSLAAVASGDFGCKKPINLTQLIIAGSPFLGIVLRRPVGAL